MQRLVKTKYPARNPFGDKVFVKFRMTKGGTMIAPASQQYVRVEGEMNDLSETLVDLGNAPGYSWYPQLFQNYRVTGLKIKFTPVINPLTSEGNTLPPQSLIAYINAGDGLSSNPAVNTLPEQRWCRYKYLNSWFQGGPTKSVSLYMSTNKLAGGDRTTSSSVTYTGTCTATTPYYSTVESQLHYEYGICTLNGANFIGPAGAKICDYMVTYTYYVTFWGRRPIIT